MIYHFVIINRKCIVDVLHFVDSNHKVLPREFPKMEDLFRVILVSLYYNGGRNFLTVLKCKIVSLTGILSCSSIEEERILRHRDN